MEMPVLIEDPAAGLLCLQERMADAIGRASPLTIDRLYQILGTDRTLSVDLLVNAVHHTTARDRLDELAETIANGPDSIEQVSKILRVAAPTSATIYLASLVFRRTLPSHPLASIADVALLSCESVFDMRVRDDHLEVRRSCTPDNGDSMTALVLDHSNPANKWMVCRGRSAPNRSNGLCLNPEVAMIPIADETAELVLGDTNIMAALKNRFSSDLHPYIPVQHPILNPCAVVCFSAPLVDFSSLTTITL